MFLMPPGSNVTATLNLTFFGVSSEYWYHLIVAILAIFGNYTSNVFSDPLINITKPLMTTIKREAGDKTKGFTLQKQRAIALFFDAIKSNVNAHINVAIEYKGDVYLQKDQVGYVEEQKNYDANSKFSFNSRQILNTLVYFLDIWFSESKADVFLENVLI